MNGTTIERLRVTHRLKPPGGGTPLAHAGGLRLDTCLREVVIDLRADGAPAIATDGAERLCGPDAYRLLLEIATGLRSSIPGETNVFGQFRRAWQAFAVAGGPEAAGLAPVIDCLFGDAKTVRRQWLEGVGGTSYGSLARRLVAPGRGDRVLFVGAGDLARSMLPLFGKCRLGLWNRGPFVPPPVPLDAVFAPGDGQRAAAWADHAILATPPAPPNDHAWHARLCAARPRSVVHLGHRDCGWGLGLDWPQGTAVFALDDVFALRRERDDRRTAQLERARRACAQLAGRWRADARLAAA